MTDPIEPMLAQKANVNRLVKLCENPEWAAEQKLDGVRWIAHVDQGTLTIRSRTGRIVTVAPKIRDAFAQFVNGSNKWVFDGEYFGKTFHVFDLVRAGKLIDASSEFSDRRLTLEALFGQWQPDPQWVQLVPSYTEHEDKADLTKHILENRGEGIMFKRLTGLYIPGGRSPDMLKVKFRKDIDCVVTELGRDGKANMVLSLYRDGQLVEIGECTALAGDGATIRVGDVVCVRILYVSADYRLVQPTLPRLHDKLAEQCTWDQLEPLQTNKQALYLPVDGC